MVEIYSICQTVIQPAFRHFSIKANQTSWRVSRDHYLAAVQRRSLQLPYELRYGLFPETYSSVSGTQL